MVVVVVVTVIVEGMVGDVAQGFDVAQLVAHRIGTQLTQVRFPGVARDFSPRVNFQCRLSYDVSRPPCAIACINKCAHVKDPCSPCQSW